MEKIEVQIEKVKTDEWTGFIYKADLPKSVVIALGLNSEIDDIDPTISVMGGFDASYKKDELVIELEDVIWLSNDKKDNRAALLRVDSELFNKEDLINKIIDRFPMDDYLANMEADKIDHAYESYRDSRGE